MADEKFFDLKPCPFCGGKADFGKNQRADESGKGFYFVQCLECHARATNICGTSFETEEKAVKAWNSRVNDEALSFVTRRLNASQEHLEGYREAILDAVPDIVKERKAIEAENAELKRELLAMHERC